MLGTRPTLRPAIRRMFFRVQLAWRRERDREAGWGGLLGGGIIILGALVLAAAGITPDLLAVYLLVLAVVVWMSPPVSADAIFNAVKAFEVTIVRGIAAVARICINTIRRMLATYKALHRIVTLRSAEISRAACDAVLDTLGICALTLTARLSPAPRLPA